MKEQKQIFSLREICRRQTTLVGIVIIVVVTIILFGGVFVWQYFLDKSQSVNRANQVEGWKMYNHQGIEFSIKYPPSWEVKDMSNNSGSAKSVLLQGAEGSVGINYGWGLGSFCPKGSPIMQINGEQFNFCDNINKDSVEELYFVKEFDAYDIGIIATINKSNIFNKDFILKIISTFRLNGDGLKNNLIGSWEQKIEDSPIDSFSCIPDSLEFEFNADLMYNSWIHCRPAESGTWGLSGDILTLTDQESFITKEKIIIEGDVLILGDQGSFKKIQLNN